MTKIMFICYGNICRSQMAQCVMQKLANERGLDLFIDSAGTSREEEGNPIYPAVERMLKKMGVPIVPHRAKQLKKEDGENFDHLICMESYNAVSTLRIVGSEHSDKVHLLLDYSDCPRDIADPWYTGDFATAYADILEGCLAFLSTISL